MLQILEKENEVHASFIIVVQLNSKLRWTGNYNNAANIVVDLTGL
jgi:hypothetical protein